MGKPNLLQRAFRRLASSNEELESEELQKNARGEGAVPIRSCEDRQLVRLSGTISSVTIHPRGGHPALEVELRDGSAGSHPGLARTPSDPWHRRRSLDQRVGPDQLSRRTPPDLQPEVRTARGRRRFMTGANESAPRAMRSTPTRARVHLRRRARSPRAHQVPRRCPRHAGGRGAVRRLHHRLGDHPVARDLPARRPGCRGDLRRGPACATAVAAVRSPSGHSHGDRRPGGQPHRSGRGRLPSRASSTTAPWPSWPSRSVALRGPLVGFLYGAAIGDPTGWRRDRGSGADDQSPDPGAGGARTSLGSPSRCHCSWPATSWPWRRQGGARLAAAGGRPVRHRAAVVEGRTPIEGTGCRRTRIRRAVRSF